MGSVVFLQSGNLLVPVDNLTTAAPQVVTSVVYGGVALENVSVLWSADVETIQVFSNLSINIGCRINSPGFVVTNDTVNFRAGALGSIAKVGGVFLADLVAGTVISLVMAVQTAGFFGLSAGGLRVRIG